MSLERVFTMKFAKVYPLYLQKVEKKGRTQDELNQVLTWLTGYTDHELRNRDDTDLRTFFEQAPQLNPNHDLIKGVVCGVRVEEVEDPLMKKIRLMDKLVDELAKGKQLEKIMRQ